MAKSEPSPALQLALFSEDSRLVVEQLWQLYRHDLSEFRGMLPGSHGRYELKFLPDFFNDPDRRGYLIRSGDQPVGFALVRGLLEPPFMMSEFFIIRPMRRVGAGSIAADLVITAHPGAWEIPFQMENIGAAPFWRRVAQSRAPNNWSEERRPVPDKPGIPPDVWISFTCK